MADALWIEWLSWGPSLPPRLEGNRVCLTFLRQPVSVVCRRRRRRPAGGGLDDGFEEVVSSKCVDSAGCAGVFPRTRVYERKASFDARADTDVFRTTCGATRETAILAFSALVGVPHAHGQWVAVLTPK